MKINRLFALAVIALLVVAGMAAITNRSLAKSPQSAPAQVEDCSQQDDDSAEAPEAADTDDIEEQCGDQSEADGPEEGEEAEDGGADPAPDGTPAITAEQAKDFALAAHPGTIVQTELDDEDGQLVYSVEFDGGVDVKIDALTGDVVKIETGQD